MSIPNVKLGSEIRLKATFKDNETKTPFDPTDVIFKIKNPVGTETIREYSVDESLEKDDTGEYHLDVVLDRAGDWRYEIIGTGTLQAESYGKIAVSTDY